jgi:type 1 glutamine amidotransferase
LFDLVIFNNSTGPVLNDEQQMAFQKYITNGGNFLGIHGSGDDSHRKWEWYQKILLGAKFSHHPLNPQFQNAKIHVEARADSGFKSWLVGEWNAKDEWYVFYEQPKEAQVLLYIDGDKILPSGNMLWMKDKNFGMGKYHPIAWVKKVGMGKMLYTSMGHSKEVWENKPFQDFIEKSISWTLK